MNAAPAAMPNGSAQARSTLPARNPGERRRDGHWTALRNLGRWQHYQTRSACGITSPLNAASDRLTKSGIDFVDNEHDARSSVLIGPPSHMDRVMDEVLHAINRYRRRLAGKVEYALTRKILSPCRLSSIVSQTPNAVQSMASSKVTTKERMCAHDCCHWGRQTSAAYKYRIRSPTIEKGGHIEIGFPRTDHRRVRVHHTAQEEILDGNLVRQIRLGQHQPIGGSHLPEFDRCGVGSATARSPRRPLR